MERSLLAILLFGITVLCGLWVRIKTRSSGTLIGAPPQDEGRDYAPSPQSYGSGRAIRPSARQTPDTGSIKLYMQVFLTVVVLPISLYLLLGRHTDTEGRNWASGTIGMVLGFWLKS